MPVANTIIDAALIDELGIYEAGETPNAADRTLCFRILNRIVSQWSTRSVFMYTETHQSFTITTSAQTYSIGSGATFDTGLPRPTKILRANLIRVADTPDSRIPLTVFNGPEFPSYAEIQNYLETADEPQALYYQPTVPTGLIYLLPIVTNAAGPLANKLEVFFPLHVLTFQDQGTTNYDLPPGYEDALTVTLAERLARSFGKSVSSELAADARRARAAIQALNAIPPRISTRDAGMPGF